jgi:hypothetical protein
MQKLVVVTAVFGKRDKVHAPRVSSKAKFVCYTDDPALLTPGWERKVIAPSGVSGARLRARQIKLCPPEEVLRHEMILWTDASFELLLDPVPHVELWLQNHSLATFKHPDQTCLYQEAEAAAKAYPETKPLLDKQQEKYRSLGVPRGLQVPATGVLARRTCDASVNEFFAEWWDEVVQQSPRDQVSFPFVQWRRSVPVYWIQGHIGRNGFVEYHDHL